MLVEQNKSKKSRPNATPRQPTGLLIREPSNTASFGLTSSSEDDADVPTQLFATFPTNNTLTTMDTPHFREGSNIKSLDPCIHDQSKQQCRDRQRARRQRLSAEQRQEINARQRAQRHSITPEQREAMNAPRRAAMKSSSFSERQERNARRRARRQTIPDGDRHELLARCNETFAARRNTPCTKSIAISAPSKDHYRLPTHHRACRHPPP